MKTFSYTCRDKDGALKRGTMQASERAEVLLTLTKQGYIPISITQGSTKTNATNSTSYVSPRTVVLTGVVIFVLIMVLAVPQLMHQKNKNEKNVSTEEKQNVEGKQELGSVAKATVSDVNKATAVEPIPVVLPRVPTNEQIEARRANVDAHGTPTQTVPEQTNNVVVDEPPSTLKTRTEQLLSMAVSVPVGTSMPPLPISANIDSDFKQSMSNTIVISDTDSTFDAERKEKVAYLKLDVDALVKEGNSPEDVIKAIEQQHNEVANRRTQLQAEMNALLEANREADAQRDRDRLREVDVGLEVAAQSLESFEPGAGADHAELVGVDARDEVCCAHAQAHALGDLGEHLVAGRAAVEVVDVAERVDVDDGISELFLRHGLSF